MAFRELPSESESVVQPTDVASLRFELKWPQPEGEELGLIQLLEHQTTLDAAVNDAVRRYLGGTVAVRDVKMSRGSVIVTVALSALVAVSRYKAFVEGLTLLMAHLQRVLENLLGPTGKGVTITGTWLPGPMLGSSGRSLTVQRVFLWCAGCDTGALARCQRSERIKHAGFGSLVVIPAFFALVSMTYAASTFTSSAYQARAIGVGWAFVVFAIDRFIVSTFRKSESVRSDVVSAAFGARVLLSLLLGLVVSHPLLLWIFRESIHDVILARQRQADTVTYRPFDDQINVRQTELTSLRASIPSISQTFAKRDQALEDLIRGGRSIGDLDRMDQLRADARRERNAEVARVNVRIKQVGDELVNIQKARDATKLRATPDDYIARGSALTELALAQRGVLWIIAVVFIAFVAVDTIPVVLKVATKRDNYDDILDSVRERTRKKTEADDAVYDELLRQTTDRRTAEIAGAVLIRDRKRELSPAVLADVSSILNDSLTGIIPFVDPLDVQNEGTHSLGATTTGFDESRWFMKIRTLMKHKARDVAISLVLALLQAVAVVLLIMSTRPELMSQIAPSAIVEMIALAIVNRLLMLLIGLSIDDVTAETV